MTSTARQHIADHTALPPAHPKFKHLDSILIALDNQPKQPRKAVLELRKRWTERAIPAFTPSVREGGSYGHHITHQQRPRI